MGNKRWGSVVVGLSLAAACGTGGGESGSVSGGGVGFGSGIVTSSGVTNGSADSLTATASSTTGSMVTPTRVGVGEPCLDDSSCTSNNCSASARVCRVAVGTPCDSTNCDLCYVYAGESFCSRECRWHDECNGGACLGSQLDDYYWCRPKCFSGCPTTCTTYPDVAASICPCTDCPLAEPIRENEPLGAFCLDAAECASGDCYNVGSACEDSSCYPRGLCSQSCAGPGDCPTGYACVDACVPEYGPCNRPAGPVPSCGTTTTSTGGATANSASTGSGGATASEGEGGAAGAGADPCASSDDTCGPRCLPTCTDSCDAGSCRELPDTDGVLTSVCDAALSALSTCAEDSDCRSGICAADKCQNGLLGDPCDNDFDCTEGFCWGNIVGNVLIGDSYCTDTCE